MKKNVKEKDKKRKLKNRKKIAKSEIQEREKRNIKQLLTGAPPRIRAPPKKSHAKSPSGITGGVAEGLFFFFCFSLFETTEICFGSTKMEISTGKKAFHANH